MNHLIIKYINGELNEDEKVDLFSMAEKDKHIHDELISAINLIGLTSYSYGRDDLQNVMSHLSKFKSTSKKPLSYWLRPILKYASVILLTFVTSLILSKYFITNQSVDSCNYEEFIVPAGQRAFLKLHDGTRMWINSNSKLIYPSKFTSNERKITLIGEGYFEVAKNKNKPFIVCTEKMNIKVLGTKFNVYAYKNSKYVSTSLLEGSVKLYKPENESNYILLKPYERVVIKNDKMIKERFDNEDFVSWKNGIYTFNDLTFSEIIRKLRVYYDIDIIVKNNKINDFRFSGKFRQIDGAESILRILQKIYPFKYEKDEINNRIIIF